MNNVQVNPAYPPQQAFGYSPVPRAPPNHPMSHFPQAQSPFPHGPAGFPPNVNLQQTPQQLYQQFQQQHAAFGRPPSQGINDLAQAQAHVPQNFQATAPYNQFERTPSHSNPPSQAPMPSPAVTSSQQSSNMAAPSTPMTPNNMIQRQSMGTPGLAQQAQLQNAAQQMQRPAQPPASSLSPQSAARERARVTVLLEINSKLLQEVVSLQAQGKAGAAPTPANVSPTSPTSATDPANALNNSPVDPSKQGPTKPPSQEYADCMRRLQANLSYLAAIADAKKKINGSLPVGPAIMIPPPHLTTVQDLYKKLNTLFPEASQSTINKAMAVASGQTPKALNTMQAQG